MKTLNTVLPVYDQLNKQLYYRAKAANKGLMAMTVTPRHRLPSMQWNVTEDTGAINSVKLVNSYTAAETEIKAYFLHERLLRPSAGVPPLSDLPTNGGYDTFTDYVGFPEKFDAVKTTAAGEAYVETCSFAIGKGESMVVRFSVYTLLGGTSPEVVIVNSLGVDISNVERISSAAYYYTLTATETDSAASVHFRNLDGETTSIKVTYFLNSVTLPGLHTELTDSYFQYSGDVSLAIPLPLGRYYLKMATNNGYIFYSEVFEVTCIYENLVTAWVNGDGIDTDDYGTLTTSGTSITNAETSCCWNAGMAIGDTFVCKKDEIIYASFYLTLVSGVLPKFIIKSGDLTVYNSYDTIEGQNFITMIAPKGGYNFCYFYTEAGAVKTQFNTYEALVFRSYSDEYLRFNFSNNCDLGDFIYQNGWTQSAWIKSEPMEMTFPQEEKGIENGQARFIRTFARQVKKYLVRTKDQPDYMAEVFHRMKLHDTIELIDLVGDTNDVYNLEVEHEWLWDDKYYCKLELTFDFDEVFVIGGCCNNLT